MIFRTCFVCLFLACLSATAGAEPPVASNPADPPVVETWSLREVWRLDNEENEDLPLMGIVNQAVVTDDRHVFFLDHQMAHVLEISPDGEYLRTLGRGGQGPGELERPNTIFRAEDGRLGLVQVFPGKAVLLNRDGTPGGGFGGDGEANGMLFRVREHAGVRALHTSTSEYSPAAMTNRPVLSCETPGSDPVVIFEREHVDRRDPPAMDEAASWFPSGVWDQAADGSIAVAAERDAYRIEWYEPDGALRRTVTRDFEPHRRNREERQQAGDRMRMWGPSGELEVKKTISDTEPAIGALQILDDGTMWVRSCYAERDLPGGVHIRYDVFDAGGRLLKEVRIECAVDRDKDIFNLLNDGRFVWYRNGKSVIDSFFAAVENHDPPQDAEEEDVGLQVILLDRAE